MSDDAERSSWVERLLPIRDVARREEALRAAGVPEPEARAILDEVHFRRKGREKFPRAARMRFTRDGLAQASSKVVAEHRTWSIRQRLGGVGRVLDACAGLGGDTIALATRWPVVAVERDAETVALLRHNLEVYGLADRVEIVEGDLAGLLQDEASSGRFDGVDCVFFDPARRTDGRRRAGFYDPPLSTLLALRRLCPNVCAKLGPLVDVDRDTPEDCDVEVVSHEGAVKEVVLWFGGLRRSPDAGRHVCATKLPERVTWERVHDAPAPPVVESPGSFLYEPDPAFVKAHLVREIAGRHGLSQLDDRIAYLTGDDRVDDPVLSRFRVHACLELESPRVSAKLGELGIGRVDFKSRGVATDLRTIHREIRGSGKRKGVVFLTRIRRERRAIICTYDRPRPAGRRRRH
ncbi:MAG: RsmD family RNA methyltransferase [Myxococcota bacterium]|nr:RsmD family RNA methyltransferase [Myxococcota bacterium]